jgi:P4 family phage/plasmid primase-like protien
MRKKVNTVTVKEAQGAAVKKELVKESIKTGSKVGKSSPIFKMYGEPFLVSDKGAVHLNERAIAARCASDHMVRFDPTLKSYERFDTKNGLWIGIHEIEVRRLLGDLLLNLGGEYDQEDFVQRNRTSQFSSLSKMLQPYQLAVTNQDTTGLVHVNNGVIDLRGKEPKVLGHDAVYPFRTSAGIEYAPKAKAPRFIKELLETALDKDDIVLLQKYFGSMLLGPNTCHGILIIRGTPGGGKSTLTSIVEKVLGESNVAHLRTQHLNGRFETSAFIGKRVLVGKDVDGDTLTEGGARLLKSLTGGDLIQAEIKYNPNKQLIRGDFHVVITSNNRLRISLDGDDGAWRRRLLIVDFEKQKTGKPIPDFANELVRDEGSGILNWLIDGAAGYRKDMDNHGFLKLSERQQQRVATLLHDSDSVLTFVEQGLSRQDDGDVSSEELLLGYYALCKTKNWKPVSGHSFQTQLPDLLCERFRQCRRNDIQREGKSVRGYKGIVLK